MPDKDWKIRGECDWNTAYAGLLPHQKLFLGRPERNAAFVGGMGSGKSFVLCMLAILNAMREPDGFSLIARLNYPALINSTMKIFLELVEERWGDFQPTARTFRFVNGHTIVFHHLDISDPKVAGPIKSMNLSAAFIDEATEISQDIYLLVDGRVRRKVQHLNMVRLASNPAGHDWVWRMYFDPTRRQSWQGYYGLNCRMDANTHLSAEYIENARSAWPDDWVQRYVYGTFADFSDLIYKEFTESTHVWDSRTPQEVFNGECDPPDDWPVIVGIDIGSDTEHDPWAIVLISVAPDGRLYQFDEIYGNGLLIASIADQLFAKLGKRARPDVAYDYAQRQCAMELAECGIVGQPAIKEVDPGIFKTAQYIHVDPRLTHPFKRRDTSTRDGDTDGSPRYFCASRCTHTIDELTSYKWAKDRSGNATGKPAHEHSHSPSAVRYAIHTFRPLPEKPQPTQIWEQPHLNLLSANFWRSELSKKPAERAKGAPLLRFVRTKGLFSRPATLRSHEKGPLVP
jgi:PBSX family phage terminase large subunit